MKHETKHCNGCGVTKPRSAFHRQSGKGPNGLLSRCKVCTNTRSKHKKAEHMAQWDAMSTAEQRQFFLEHYSYDPDSGVLYVRKRLGQRSPKVGEPANTTEVGGYLRIRTRGRHMKVHRVVWLMVTGEWPEDTIDHINFVRDDNRWSNLREMSRSDNVKRRQRDQ